MSKLAWGSYKECQTAVNVSAWQPCHVSEIFTWSWIFNLSGDWSRGEVISYKPYSTGGEGVIKRTMTQWSGDEKERRFKRGSLKTGLCCCWLNFLTTLAVKFCNILFQDVWMLYCGSHSRGGDLSWHLTVARIVSAGDYCRTLKCTNPTFDADVSLHRLLIHCNWVVSLLRVWES